jgi:quercetin dioxygenase-like cupin family protein
MVTRSADAKERSFKGVSFDLLATEERAMVTKMRYAVGNNVPFHQHPHTQAGYVISGRYRFRTQGHPKGDFDGELGPGDSYVVPGGIDHAIIVIEPGEVVDVFTPPREDYL